IAPNGHAGIYVGAAVSAYGLPSVVGAFMFARFLRGKPARRLVLLDCALRSLFLGAIALTRASGALGPVLYVGLLALSSLLAAWGLAGKYTLLAELVGPDARLAAYSMLTAIGSATVIIGPALAGVLVAALGPGPL